MLVDQLSRIFMAIHTRAALEVYVVSQDIHRDISTVMGRATTHMGHPKYKGTLGDYTMCKLCSRAYVLCKLQQLLG